MPDAAKMTLHVLYKSLDLILKWTNSILTVWDLYMFSSWREIQAIEGELEEGYRIGEKDGGKRRNFNGYKGRKRTGFRRRG